MIQPCHLPFLFFPSHSSPRTTTTVGCRLSTSLKCDCRVLFSLPKTLCSNEQAGPLLGPSAYQDEAGAPGPMAELSLLQHWGTALKWRRRTQGGGGRSQLSRFESRACSGVTVARVQRQPPDIWYVAAASWSSREWCSGVEDLKTKQPQGLKTVSKARELFFILQITCSFRAWSLTTNMDMFSSWLARSCIHLVPTYILFSSHSFLFTFEQRKSFNCVAVVLLFDF